MKKFIISILMLCTIFTSVFATSELPTSIKEYKENGNTYIVKNYEVEEINENEFERNIVNKFKDGFKIFKIDNISKTGGTEVLTKEETQIKIVETDSNKIEDVLPLFQSEIEYSEDDEYKGKLVLDTSSIVTTKVADGSYYKKYNVSETVEYRNYSKNDMDRMPKTKVKNGVNMHLISVDWKVQNTQTIGTSQVPVSYIAVAYYKGTGTQKVEGQAKYTSSATYTGTIEKEINKPLEYEITYSKVADYTIWIVIDVILFVLGLIFILVGFIGHIKIKKQKNQRRFN